MAKNETSITSEKRAAMPPRGRNKRTLILEAMKKQAQLNVGEKAADEDCERAWFELLIKEAVDSESSNSGLCLRLITERGWSALKPSSELVSFEFDPAGTAADKADQILYAISQGLVPMDYGKEFISSINAMTNIELNTDLKERIEKIELSLAIAT